MPQRMVTITIENVGSKDLFRQKMELIRILGTVVPRSDLGLSRAANDRLEGLLNFLDACTDQCRDGLAKETGVGPENWEDK